MRSPLHPVFLALLVVSSGCSDVPTAPPTPTDSPQLAQDIIIEQAPTPTALCYYSSSTGDATVSWSNLSVMSVRFSSGTDPNSPSYQADLDHPMRFGLVTKEKSAFPVVKVFLYGGGMRLLADPTCAVIA
jgi:hypothetical protein